jgi:restriction system protein
LVTAKPLANAPDGDCLADLMIYHGAGVRVARTLEAKRLDEDSFVEE